MAERSTRTQTAEGQQGSSTDVTPAPCLYLVVQAHRPVVPGWRASLAGVDEVIIGRGDRQLECSTAGGRRRLVVRVDDRWMSSEHARLSRRAGVWSIEDGPSKNGTLINGVRVPASPLCDGDVIELGRTFWLFREAVETGADDPLLDDAPLQAPPGLGTLIPPLARRFADVRRVAASAVTMALCAETGSGKEILARTIHELSGRTGPLVAVNCGALPDALVESEIFGARKGAFSGAHEDRPGLVRTAHRGTLFLDEVADLSPHAQAVLLRVLQERQVVPVGGTHPVAVDFRAITATHRDLEHLVASGAFRRDLRERLAGVTVEIPPLRERREDLGLLSATLLSRHLGARADGIVLQPPLVRALLAYSWPGNVRELEKVLTSALALSGDRTIGLEHVPEAVREGASPRPLDAEEAEHRDRLDRLLREHGGNLAGVARALGKGRTQIQRWIRRYRLDPDRYR